MYALKLMSQSAAQTARPTATDVLCIAMAQQTQMCTMQESAARSLVRVKAYTFRWLRCMYNCCLLCATQHAKL